MRKNANKCGGMRHENRCIAVQQLETLLQKSNGSHDEARRVDVSILFVAATVVCLNAMVWRMPKHLTKKEMFATVCFALALQQTVDIYLALKFNFYGYFGGGVRYITLFAILGIYPAVNLLYLNFFQICRGVWSKVVYIALWSSFAVFYEWLSVKTGFFYHQHWRYWYSAIIYPVLFLTLNAALWVYRRIGNKSSV